MKQTQYPETLTRTNIKEERIQISLNPSSNNIRKELKKREMKKFSRFQTFNYFKIVFLQNEENVSLNANKWKIKYEGLVWTWQ